MCSKYIFYTLADKMQKLDLNKWVTQQALADELGVSIQAVHNWINRNKIQYKTLPGNTTLVNKDTLTIKEGIGRPRNSRKSNKL